MGECLTSSLEEEGGVHREHLQVQLGKHLNRLQIPIKRGWYEHRTGASTQGLTLTTTEWFSGKTGSGFTGKHSTLCSASRIAPFFLPASASKIVLDIVEAPLV